jgi:hypothetical protein
VGADDASNINFFLPNESTTAKFTEVPISECVKDATACPWLYDPKFISGQGSKSSEVTYGVGACLWSWVAGDTVDPASVCADSARPVISVRDVTKAERNSGVDDFRFIVALSAPSASPVTVRFATSGGTATAGSDYAALPGAVLTFVPGETRKTVNVAVRGDAITEPDETFAVILSQPQGADIADGEALATIVNDDVDVGPVVSSLVLKNETGATIDGPVVALYGMRIDLHAAFSGATPLDTHTAIIDWGDGSFGPGTVDESAGNGTVRASHTWTVPGFYTVRVSVTDDDATTDSRQLTINVKDGASAVCQASWFELSMMTDGSLDGQTWYAARRMLGRLWGELDDRPGAGACNLIVQGNGMAALEAIGDAVGMIEALIAAGQLNASQVGELRRFEGQLMLTAKWLYVQVVRVTVDPQRLADAAVQAGLAEAALDAQDYEAATDLWIQAVRLLVGT